MWTLSSLCQYVPLIRLRHTALYKCVFDLIWLIWFDMKCTNSRFCICTWKNGPKRGEWQLKYPSLRKSGPLNSMAATLSQLQCYFRPYTTTDRIVYIAPWAAGSRENEKLKKLWLMKLPQTKLHNVGRPSGWEWHIICQLSSLWSRRQQFGP